MLKQIKLEKKNLAKKWAVDGLLKVNHCKTLFRVEDSTIRGWYQEGKLKAIKLGKTPQSPVRITLCSVLKLIDLYQFI